MRDIWLIAKREYLEQVRSKTFKITTILIPLLFAGIIGIAVLAGKSSGSGKHIAVAASDSALADSIRTQLLADKDARMTVDIVAPAADSDRQTLLAKVDRKELDGFLWLNSSSNDNKTTATYAARTSGDFTTEARLSDAVNHAVVRQRLTAHGIPSSDVAALTSDIKIETEQVKNGKAETSSALGTIWAAYIMAFLLSFTAVAYGMNVGRSVIQEKTSRIFEVMLATVKPGDMLAGKLIGIGAVGLSQLVIWAAAGLLFSSTALASSLMSGGLKIQISYAEIVLFVVYFLLGYALYSALFAGLAATCDTEQELQQYAPLAAVPIWVSFGMITFIVSNPNSIWSVAISMFPPCAPITMFLRIASQFPPLWQIATSVALMAISVYGVVWFSSRIYRVGILMYGKRATIPEMLRWLRYS